MKVYKLKALYPLICFKTVQINFFHLNNFKSSQEAKKEGSNAEGKVDSIQSDSEVSQIKVKSFLFP